MQHTYGMKALNVERKNDRQRESERERETDSLSHYEFLCITLRESLLPCNHIATAKYALRCTKNSIQLIFKCALHCEHAKTSASIICRFYTWQKRCNADKKKEIKPKGRQKDKIDRRENLPRDGRTQACLLFIRNATVGQ